LKRLRYAIEFVSSLYGPQSGARYLRQLEPAQECLGRYNDLSGRLDIYLRCDPQRSTGMVLRSDGSPPSVRRRLAAVPLALKHLQARQAILVSFQLPEFVSDGPFKKASFNPTHNAIAATDPALG